MNQPQQVLGQALEDLEAPLFGDVLMHLCICASTPPPLPAPPPARNCKRTPKGQTHPQGAPSTLSI